jgi:tripartite-type tricarboxylate transporter receptor subunit TctC
MNRLWWLALAAMLFGLTAGSPARADSYPSGKITLIVAFAPGGIADTLARLIAQGLSERLHQPVVVDNRSGAGGNLAAAIVARAAPDGYTLLATTTALAVNQTLFVDKPFGPRDFRTIAIAAQSPEAILTDAAEPATTLADFLKRHAGKSLNIAVPGVGTVSDIEAQYFFKFIAKTPAQMVPFQGGAPAINAAMGKQVDLLAITLGGGAAAQIAGGKLKGLAVAADKRASAAPNVPTFVEQGYPDYDLGSWIGFFAPAKTDDTIVDLHNAQITNILRTEDVQKKLAEMGFDAITLPASKADTLYAVDAAKWGAMVKALGLSIQ